MHATIVIPNGIANKIDSGISMLLNKLNLKIVLTRPMLLSVIINIPTCD